MGHSHEADTALLGAVHTPHSRLWVKAGDIHVFLRRGHGVLKGGVFGGLRGGSITNVEPEDASAAVYLSYVIPLSGANQIVPIMFIPCGLGMARRALVSHGRTAAAVRSHFPPCVSSSANRRSTASAPLVFDSSVKEEE